VVARLEKGGERFVAEAEGLRAQCALACLTRTGDIAPAYDLALAPLEHEGIDGRTVGLRSPLLALGADSEDTEMRPDILHAAKATRQSRLLTPRRGRPRGSSRPCERSASGTVTRSPRALRARLGVGLGEEYPAAGWSPEPLGVVRQQVRDRARRRWCYVLSAEQLTDLPARYGGAADTDEQPDGAALATCSRSNPVTSGDNGDNPHE
jgi:hypothetical protein